jgi:hypothetical protein
MNLLRRPARRVVLASTGAGRSPATISSCFAYLPADFGRAAGPAVLTRRASTGVRRVAVAADDEPCCSRDRESGRCRSVVAPGSPEGRCRHWRGGRGPHARPGAQQDDRIAGDLFHAIDNPLLRIPGRERGERSPTCACVPRETDRLVSRFVSTPPVSSVVQPIAAVVGPSERQKDADRLRYNCP